MSYIVEGFYEAIVPVVFFLVLGVLYVFVEAWKRNWRIVCQTPWMRAKANKLWVRGYRTHNKLLMKLGVMLYK